MGVHKYEELVCIGLALLKATRWHQLIPAVSLV